MKYISQVHNFLGLQPSPLIYIISKGEFCKVHNFPNPEIYTRRAALAVKGQHPHEVQQDKLFTTN